MKASSDFDPATGMYLSGAMEVHDGLETDDCFYNLHDLMDKEMVLSKSFSWCDEIKIPDLPSLLDITLDQISNGLTSGHFTCVDLTRAYLGRIDEVNDEIKAVIEINPEAMKIAETLDNELRYGISRGPLHGVPILIKDNIVTCDSMEASAGSYALIGAKPSNEASVVARLREAGAVILGKANLCEFSCFRSEAKYDGWSARGGQCMHAYRKDANPTGSSGGSAVAVAMGLCAVALGTETDGSLVKPSGANNVVAIKPSVGLTARDGVIPISWRQDTVGPIARTLKDACTVLSIIAGHSELDPATTEAPYPVPEYGQSCTDKISNLPSLRVGIPRNALQSCTPHALKMMEKFTTTLSASSLIIQDPTTLTAFSAFKAWDEVALRENAAPIDFLADMNAYLSTLSTNPNNIHSVEDLRDHLQQDPREGYPLIDTFHIDTALEYAALGLDKHSTNYASAMAKNELYAGTGGILGALDEHDCDALMFPEACQEIVNLAARLGLPIITVPAGFFGDDVVDVKGKSGGRVDRGKGIPWGMCFVGRKWAELELIRIAAVFERLCGDRGEGRIKPWKSASTELVDVF